MSLDDGDVFRPVTSLEKGLNIRELIRDSVTEFEITPDDDEEDNYITAADFNFEEIEQKLVNLDLIEVDESEDGVDSSPYDKYRRQMFDLRPDGKLKKFVKKPGVGKLVPDKCVVYVRYQAYVEYNENPFDSTLLQRNGERDDPVKFNLAKAELIPGLHAGLLTMQEGEIAQFLIHQDLAYSDVGCAPRIPPEATVLFIVELVRFVDCAEAFADDEDIPIEERNQYCNIIKKAKDHYILGNDSFKMKNFVAAAQKYRLVISMMHNARLANEQEEHERNHFLIKIYTNSIVCYFKLKHFKKVCSSAADAVKFNRREAMNNFKLLYFWGKAKMMLGDYVTAKKHLLAALRLNPKEKEIGQTLMELDHKVKSAAAQEKIMWQRACNFQPSSVKLKEVTDEEESFRATISKQLTEFKFNREEQYLILKQHFAREEEKIVLTLARDLGLYGRVSEGSRRLIEIKKPKEQW